MAYKKSTIAQNKIIDVSMELFQTQGYHETTMGDIAREAGMTRSSLYYYFKDKTDLADKLIDIISEDIDEIIAKRDENNEDPLITVILSLLLIIRSLKRNKMMTPYDEIVDYTDYDVENLNRIVNHYSFPAVWKLHKQYGKTLTQGEKHVLVIMTNVMIRALFKGIFNGNLDYSEEDAINYVLDKLLIQPLQIPANEYKEKLNEAVLLAEELQI